MVVARHTCTGANTVLDFTSPPILVRDMTGDSKPEILFFTGQMGASGGDVFVHIFRLTGKRLVSLVYGEESIKHDASGSGYFLQDKVQIVSLSNWRDPREEHLPNSEKYGLWHIDVYSYKGGRFRLLRSKTHWKRVTNRVRALRDLGVTSKRIVELGAKL